MAELGFVVLRVIAEEIRKEADQAARPGQLARLEALADRVDEVADGWGVDYV